VDALDLSVSNPTRAGFPYDAETILQSLVQPEALDYDPQPKGMLTARQAVTRYYHDAHGLYDLDPESLILTTSTSEGYSYVFRLLCNPDDEILVPLQTARFRVNGSDRLQSISALAESEEKIPDAMADIQRVLRRQHRIRQGAPDDFQIRNQSDILATFQDTTKTFTYLLAGIAAVSLLVGGIGIMNIMLVSVTERTREIGVRKALGATRFNILFQFLVEALVLCLVGGILGILFGTFGAIGLSSFLHWNTSINVLAILAAFFFSAMVGLFFGIWPARRAARLDPIVALRYE